MGRPFFVRAIFVVWALAMSSAALAESEAGDTLDLADYRGKVVVLDFWASWCVPCRRSFPWLNSMQAKYEQDGLVIIGVNVDRDPDNAAGFLQKYPANFEIRYDPRANLAKEFGVQAMPSSFVIGRDGKTWAHHLGFKVKRQIEYEAAIAAALEQEGME